MTCFQRSAEAEVVSDKDDGEAAKTIMVGDTHELTGADYSSCLV